MNFNRHPFVGGGGGGGGRGEGGGLGPEKKGGGDGGSGLARQLSVYSLTFDEFQSTLGGPGKDFGSMNMDELLKNIWTAEESQAMGAALPGFSDAGLQRQGSLTLPRTISQKTVDEVWRDLVLPGPGPPVPSACAAPATAAATAAGVSNQHRQPTLGEITLEEFLVRAGVVREEPVAPSTAVLPPRPIADSSNSSSRGNRAINNVLFGDLSVANNATGLSLGFGPAGRNSRDVAVASPITNSGTTNLAVMAASGTSPFGVPHNVVDLGNHQGIRGSSLVGIGEAGMNNGLMSGAVGLGAATGPVSVVSPVNRHLPSDSLRNSGGDQSSVSPVPYVFSGGLRGRKSGAVEKVYERRQRRMIKNRESAARSRARKQAYTMELEAEVAKLKELNQELQKKQAEMMEMQKNQVLEIINNQRGPKKRCLRRTQTGPW